MVESGPTSATAAGSFLSDEQRQLRDTAREFATRELESHAERWDRQREFPKEAADRLAELGFFGLLVPEEEGGSGFDTLSFCLAVEEISRSVPALGLLLSIHNGPVCHLLRTAGSSAARERWLPRLAAGEVLGAFALTEAAAGSDATALETRFVREGAEYVLTGRKEWVSGVGVCRLAVVFAAGPTAVGIDGAAVPAGGERRQRPRPITAFAVDLSLPGVASGGVEETMGMRALPVGTLALERVGVSRESLLGTEGEGFRLVQDALALGRLGIAAQSLGIAGRCIDSARVYAAERRQFGRPIASFQGVRLPLADLAARAEAVRSLIGKASAVRDLAVGAGEGREGWGGESRAPGRERGRSAPVSAGVGEDFPVLAAMAKLLASDLAMDAALQAVQTYGGYGYIKDYPVERFFRDAKACQIYEGTNEIQRVVIARRLFDD